VFTKVAQTLIIEIHCQFPKHGTMIARFTCNIFWQLKLDKGHPHFMKLVVIKAKKLSKEDQRSCGASIVELLTVLKFDE
jgi:hypothetical protein